MRKKSVPKNGRTEVESGMVEWFGFIYEKSLCTDDFGGKVCYGYC